MGSSFGGELGQGGRYRAWHGAAAHDAAGLRGGCVVWVADCARPVKRMASDGRWKARRKMEGGRKRWPQDEAATCGAFYIMAAGPRLAYLALYSSGAAAPACAPMAAPVGCLCCAAALRPRRGCIAQRRCAVRASAPGGRSARICQRMPACLPACLPARPWHLACCGAAPLSPAAGAASRKRRWSRNGANTPCCWLPAAWSI